MRLEHARLVRAAGDHAVAVAVVREHRLLELHSSGESVVHAEVVRRLRQLAGSQQDLEPERAIVVQGVELPELQIHEAFLSCWSVS